VAPSIVNLVDYFERIESLSTTKICTVNEMDMKKGIELPNIIKKLLIQKLNCVDKPQLNIS